MASEKGGQDSIKWWVDHTKSGRERSKDEPPPPAAARFYVTARGYDQERARAGLVDLNTKFLHEANPPANGFGYLNLIDEPSPPHILDKVKRSVRLPEGARAVIVDAGKMLRVIVTGNPVGERILEFNFNRSEPSFDVWVRGEWKEEIVFRDLAELYRSIPKLVERYMGAEALAKPEFLT
ncbi:MAG: hypothetical protein ACREQ9_22585 [Candidatus Binatia bacterium]